MRRDLARADDVCAALAAVPGVRRVFVEGPPWRAVLVCEPAEDAEATRLELAARAALLDVGWDPRTLELEVAFLAPPPPRRRVRLLEAELTYPRLGEAAARVRLEWDGQVFEGRAAGTAGEGPELRWVALATLNALAALLDGRLRFDLVGIKQLRIFDTDLAVAVVRSPERLEGMTGAAFVGEDRPEAAARAVLQATNRVLGNYLTVPD